MSISALPGRLPAVLETKPDKLPVVGGGKAWVVAVAVLDWPEVFPAPSLAIM